VKIFTSVNCLLVCYIHSINFDPANAFSSVGLNICRYCTSAHMYMQWYNKYVAMETISNYLETCSCIVQSQAVVCRTPTCCPNALGRQRTPRSFELLSFDFFIKERIQIHAISWHWWCYFISPKDGLIALWERENSRFLVLPGSLFIFTPDYRAQMF